MKKLILMIPLLLWGLTAFSQVTDLFMTGKATEIRTAGPGQNTADRIATFGQYLIDSKVNLSQYAFVTATGTNTYAATIFPAITTYTGLRVVVKFTNANTGPSTLNFNSLGAKSIVDESGNPLVSGIIPANSIKYLAYNGTALQLVGGSGTGGGGTVTSVSGTASRISSTGGATPVIDIHATFEALLGKIANPLSQFASTTSAQLAGVLSNETGTGLAVFSASPTFTGVPLAPTPSLGTNTPQIATAAEVLAEIANASVGPFSTIAAGYTNLSGNANSIPKGNNTWIAPGANGQVMNVVAGVPTWSDLVLGPFSTTLNGYMLASGGAGRIPQGDNSWIAPGSAGKILYSNGTNFVNSVPTFPASASATTRKIIISDGTNWTASPETYAVPGTSGNVMTSNGTNWTSAAPTSAGWNTTGATTFTGPVTINGSATNTLTWDFGNLGSTDTDGAGGLYTNTTAATSGTFLVSQNHSPNIAFKAFAYKSNATAASKSSVMRISNDPLQATSGIVGNLAVKSNIDGAGDKYIFAIQRNELNGTTVNIYDTYTNATTYDRLLLSGDYFGVNAGFAIIKDRPGSSGALYIGNEQDGTIQFRVNAGQRWSIYNAGSAYSFVPNADNVYDLGGNPVAGNIARNIYGYKMHLGGSAAPAATAEITQAALSSAWQPSLIVQPGAHTAMTAATEFINNRFKAVTQTWNSGTTTLERGTYFEGQTINSTSGTATFTDIATVYFDPPIAGTTASFTNGPFTFIANGKTAYLDDLYLGSGSTGGSGRKLIATGSSSAVDFSLKNKGAANFYFETTSGSALLTPAGSATSLVLGGSSAVIITPDLQANSNIVVNTIGKGILIKEGSNATMGVATLSGGTVTVSTTKVTANSRIITEVQSLGTVTIPSSVGVTARTAGTSFVITSSAATDTSVIAWWIFEPAP